MMLRLLAFAVIFSFYDVSAQMDFEELKTIFTPWREDTTVCKDVRQNFIGYFDLDPQLPGLESKFFQGFTKAQLIEILGLSDIKGNCSYVWDPCEKYGYFQVTFRFSSGKVTGLLITMS